MTYEETRSRIQNAIGVHDENSAGDSEKSKKERTTEEEMGRLYQRMDRNGVWRFPEAAEDREAWKGIVATSSVVPPRLRH